MTTKYSRANNFVIKGLSYVRCSPRKMLRAGIEHKSGKTQTFGSLAHSQECPSLAFDSNVVLQLATCYGKQNQSLFMRCLLVPNVSSQLQAAAFLWHLDPICWRCSWRGDTSTCVSACCRTNCGVSTLFEPESAILIPVSMGVQFPTCVAILSPCLWNAAGCWNQRSWVWKQVWSVVNLKSFLTVRNQ